VVSSALPFVVSVAGASYNDPGQGTRGGSIILPSRFLPILIYFSIIFCGRTQSPKDSLLGYTWCVLEEVDFGHWGVGGNAVTPEILKAIIEGKT